MTTQEVVEALQGEWERLNRAVASIGDRVETASVTEEGWTTKDVLAHLIHWAGQINFGLVQHAVKTGRIPETEMAKLRPPAYATNATGKPTGEEWNAMAVEHFKNSSLDEVNAELVGIYESILERSRALSDEEMNSSEVIPWAGQRPLWQQIGSETFLHWPAHSETIEAATST